MEVFFKLVPYPEKMCNGLSLPRLSSLRAASPRLGSGAGEVDIEGGGVRGSDLRNMTKFVINNPSSVAVL